MKKLLILGSALFSFPLLTHASNLACLDTPHSAVDPYGTCQEFSSSCDIPSDWKVVPSCDLVENNEYRPTLEQKQNQRTLRIAYRSSDPSVSTDESRDRIRQYREARIAARRNAQRPSSASIYDNQGKSDTDKTGYEARRTSTDRDYYSPYRSYTRKGNTTNEDVSETAMKHQTQAQNARERLGSVLRKSAIRTGTLSNAPKWSYETRIRAGRRTYDYENRVWKSFETIRDEQRPEKEEHVPESPTLRRIYKGSRLDGDLSGDIEYLEQEAKERAELRQQLEEEESGANE